MKDIIRKLSIFLLGVTIGISATAKLETATFAGGCFWCLEAAFEKLQGVTDVTSGYMGGHKVNPNYKEVKSGTTGHLEAIQLKFDPKVITYQKLLDYYWRQINPTDAIGQFIDRGSNYTSAIFYHDQQQKELAEQSKRDLEKSGRFSKLIVTKILPAQTFYPAEEYHQNYHKKNPKEYQKEHASSGRNEFFEKIWGESS